MNDLIRNLRMLQAPSRSWTCTGVKVSNKRMDWVLAITGTMMRMFFEGHPESVEATHQLIKSSIFLNMSRLVLFSPGILK